MLPQICTYTNYQFELELSASSLAIFTTIGIYRYPFFFWANIWSRRFCNQSFIWILKVNNYNCNVERFFVETLNKHAIFVNPKAQTTEPAELWSMLTSKPKEYIYIYIYRQRLVTFTVCRPKFWTARLQCISSHDWISRRDWLPKKCTMFLDVETAVE